MAVKAEPREVTSYARTATQDPRPERRIVWVLFDELSYDQVFEHRQADIRLPNFDGFARASTSFSNVAPAGYYTELIIPSLLWGRQIRQERSDFAGRAAVKTADGWQKFPEDQTLFANADRAGMRAGAAGWYIPYCRTYARELDWCEEVLGSPLPGNYSPEKPVMWNVLAPVRKPLERLTGHRLPQPTTAEEHAEQYRKLMDAGRQLIADESLGFVFIHLPAPHPGGFYNRRSGRLGTNGSYIDNLVLSDAALGELMGWIADSPAAARTTVIVSSDHSWRVGMWKISPMWTAEDAQASQGRFDPRPVLMVRFPGSTSGEKIDAGFPELRTHELIEELIAGKMASNADLEGWASGMD
jgi:Sulfatase